MCWVREKELNNDDLKHRLKVSPMRIINTILIKTTIGTVVGYYACCEVLVNQLSTCGLFLVFHILRLHIMSGTVHGKKNTVAQEERAVAQQSLMTIRQPQVAARIAASF